MTTGTASLTHPSSGDVTRYIRVSSGMTRPNVRSVGSRGLLHRCDLYADDLLLFRAHLHRAGTARRSTSPDAWPADPSSA